MKEEKLTTDTTETQSIVRNYYKQLQEIGQPGQNGYIFRNIQASKTKSERSKKSE